MPPKKAASRTRSISGRVVGRTAHSQPQLEARGKSPSRAASPFRGGSALRSAGLSLASHSLERTGYVEVAKLSGIGAAHSSLSSGPTAGQTGDDHGDVEGGVLPASCSEDVARESAVSSRSRSLLEHATRAYDVVLIGTVFTGSQDVWAECVAFSRDTGLITFVGSRDDLLNQTKEGALHRAEHCTVCEVPGLVLPGFHDAHCHPFGAGNRLRQQDPHASAEDSKHRECALDLSSCASWAEVEKQLAAAVSQKTVAAGNSLIFAEGCRPSIIQDFSAAPSTILERLSPGRSIVVVLGEPEALGALEVIVSETALLELPKLCSSWTYSSEDIAIEQSDEGTPTGRFRNETWATRFSLLSPASVASKGLRGLQRGLLELMKHGIVAFTDAFVFEGRVPMYELIAQQQQLLPRASLAIGLKNYLDAKEISALLERVKPLHRAWIQTGFRLCIREAKVEIDNIGWSSSSRHGRSSWNLAELDRVIHCMVAAGFSLHCHVFGDLAAKHAIHSIRCAEAAVQPTDPPRHKLAHVFELRREDEDAVASSVADGNVLPSSIFACYQPYWFSDKAWSSYEEQAVQTHNRLVAQEAVCYGSDWDISSLSPIAGIEAALMRPGTFHSGSFSKRLAQAVQLQTVQAARAMWLEHVSGTLEVGKFADICVLDRNMFSAAKDQDVETSLRAEVVATILKGILVYEANSQAAPATAGEIAPPPIATFGRRPPRTSKKSSSLTGANKAENDFLQITCGCLDSKCLKADWRSWSSPNRWCTAPFSGRK